MIDEPNPEQKKKEEKYLTSEERVHQLRKDLKFIDTQPSGAYYHELPINEYISDAKHLSGKDVKESYDVFFELLISIPVLAEVVGRYLKKYRYDLINRMAPGLTQPRIIYTGNNVYVDFNIYTTVDSVSFPYSFPTDLDIEEETEKRKRDYRNIICIIWLINILRSNVPTYRRMGLFNNTVIPRPKNILEEYKAIKKIIEEVYQPELTEIIVKEIFAILNIKPHEFLMEPKESETDEADQQEP